MSEKKMRLVTRSDFDGLVCAMILKELNIIDEIKFDEIKTKKFQGVLDALKLNKAIVILDENDKNVILSARNIQGVITAQVNTINVYDILKYDTLVIEKNAIKAIEEVYA